ncbi:MAG: hypothetical protein FKY71_06445 [Spiribacter salinus]|uniref:Pilus assembly protein n=1 Tax=Spiribacter salinus TaxID=1335746 RepID=A0A540VSV7_9GAMM|nr:MAG: hypothetical protein FKY71_06445 [Spiribacter salinus]
MKSMGLRVKRCGRRGRRAQMGLSTIETVSALPIIIILVAGVYEYIRIKQTSVTVEHAALFAARQGAVESADPEALDRGFARGLAPLYGDQALHASTSGNCFEGSGGASECMAELEDTSSLGSAARGLAMDAISDNFAEVVIINPTLEHFGSMALESGPEVNGDSPYLPNAGLQRRHMNEPTGGVTRTRIVTDEVHVRQSVANSDALVEWIRGNGHAAGITGWDIELPVLEEVEPDYIPGFCAPDGVSDGSDGDCDRGRGSRWPEGNDANGDNHEFDADHFADLARSELPGSDETIEISEVSAVLNRLSSEADKIRQYECTRRGAAGNCWPRRDDWDGPELYEAAWMNYFEEMKSNIDDITTVVTEEVEREITYTDHTQPSRGDIQDANLLKVLAIYGYEPVVPLPWLSNLMSDTGAGGEGFYDHIYSHWDDNLGAGFSGEGYDLILQAGRAIIDDGRVPIVKTAVVRMQSPVIGSDHMVSLGSSYFDETVPPPTDAVNPDDSASPDDWPFPEWDSGDDDVILPEDDFTLEQCTNADTAIRYAEEEDFDPDEDGLAYSVLDDLGLWSEDRTETEDNFEALKAACADIEYAVGESDIPGADDYLKTDEWVLQLPPEPVVEATFSGSGTSGTLSEGCYGDPSVLGSWDEPVGPWPDSVTMSDITRVTMTWTPDGCTRCGVIDREFTSDTSGLPDPGSGYDLAICVHDDS